MSKRKTHKTLLMAMRFFITFLPMLPFVASFFTFAINHTDTGVSFASPSFQWWESMQEALFESMSYTWNQMSFSGFFATIADAFGTLLTDILGIEDAPFVLTLVPALAWYVTAQLIYFVLYVFDFFFELTTGLMDRLSRGVING